MRCCLLSVIFSVEYCTAVAARQWRAFVRSVRGGCPWGLCSFHTFLQSLRTVRQTGLPSKDTRNIGISSP